MIQTCPPNCETGSGRALMTVLVEAPLSEATKQATHRTAFKQLNITKNKSTTHYIIEKK